MQPAPKPANEKERLEALKKYLILDTPPEKIFDDITYLASVVCKVPMAFIGFINEDDVWFKSKVGLTAEKFNRYESFCSHTINEPDVMFIVPDATRDKRFENNPLVLNYPKIRFYASASLSTEDGETIGTLCVIDDKPRRMSEQQFSALRALGRLSMIHLETRRALLLAEKHKQRQKKQLIQEIKEIHQMKD